MYSKCGSIKKASFSFDNMHKIISWNAIITRYARNDYRTMKPSYYLTNGIWMY